MTVFTPHVEMGCVAPARVTRGSRSPKELESSYNEGAAGGVPTITHCYFAVLKFSVIFVIHRYQYFIYREFYVYCLYILLKPRDFLVVVYKDVMTKDRG